MNLEKSERKKQVLYDNTCGFCIEVINRFKTNANSELEFKPVQDATSRQLLRTRKISFVNLYTIYFVDENRVYTKSSAVFQMIKHSKFPLKGLLVFSLLPQRFTNYLYDLVAKNRYKFSSKKNVKSKTVNATH